MSEAKRYVYVLQSKPHPRRHYVGLTSDIAARLEAHNGGQSASTALHRPWQVLAAVEFANPHSAALFERYLKSASGRAFAKRHFV